MTAPRFVVVTFHGKRSTSFTIVDTAAPEAEQPSVVMSFSTLAFGNASWLAADYCTRHNANEAR